jgi:hypothetical protein
MHLVVSVELLVSLLEEVGELGHFWEEQGEEVPF